MESENGVPVPPVEDEKRVVLENSNGGEGSFLESNKYKNPINSDEHFPDHVITEDKEGLLNSPEEPDFDLSKDDVIKINR
ncbi:hypothetical protein OROGR_024003 [Orobanche gracilis]